MTSRERELNVNIMIGEDGIPDSEKLSPKPWEGKSFTLMTPEERVTVLKYARSLAEQIAITLGARTPEDITTLRDGWVARFIRLMTTPTDVFNDPTNITPEEKAESLLIRELRAKL